MKWFKSSIHKKNTKGTYKLSEEDIRWNRFIEEICFKEISTLSPIQKNAVLSFWYDSEMNSGGHSGYFDCYPETQPHELLTALDAIGALAMADNFKDALQTGEADDYETADNAFYSFEPSLTDVLMKYVERYKDDIFL
jgi:hypothetical protein